MAKHRCYSVEFKRQVAQEYLAGETLHGLAKRHLISRNMIRIWVARYEAGGFDGDMVAADIMQAQEARIAALERLVGKITLENEFLKGASRAAARREARLHPSLPARRPLHPRRMPSDGPRTLDIL